MKSTLLSLIQPAFVVLVVLFWSLAPAAIVESAAAPIIVSCLILAAIQALEFVLERHEGWRINRREFLTDAFYVALNMSVIDTASKLLADDPLKALKGSLGIVTPWTEHLPIAVQIALAVFLIELGQYWMHRLMHNSLLWWTHAPHHHITQLNALKGAVGNPLELFLISLSVVALFDFKLNALLGAGSVLTVIAAFAHANLRFVPPRWYSFFFTTIEHHSLHHSVPYEDTLCNYANCLILCDRVFGTFRSGEASVVGQDDRRRLSIREQFQYPMLPLLAWWKGRRGEQPAV